MAVDRRHGTLPAEKSGSGAATRLAFIDGLRGLAMLMVLQFHCWAFGGQWKIDIPLGNQAVDIASLSRLGSAGVSLFLVLSGFCLYWPMVKGSGRAQITLKQFALKRCRRILP